MTNHEAVRFGDEYQCAKCGKTWEANDPEPPPCLTAQDRIKELRETLSNGRTSDE